MAAEGLEGTRVSRVKRPAKGKRTVTSWGGANGGAEPVLGNQRKENRALETDPTPPRALGLRNQGPGTSRRGDAGDPGTWVGGWLSICLGSSWTLNSSSDSEQGGAPSPHSPDRRSEEPSPMWAGVRIPSLLALGPAPEFMISRPGPTLGRGVCTSNRSQVVLTLMPAVHDGNHRMTGLLSESRQGLQGTVKMARLTKQGWWGRPHTADTPGPFSQEGPRMLAA